MVRILDDPIRFLFFERVREGQLDKELSKRLNDLFTGRS